MLMWTESDFPHIENALDFPNCAECIFLKTRQGVEDQKLYEIQTTKSYKTFQKDL